MDAWLSSVEAVDEDVIGVLSAPEVPKVAQESYLKDDLQLDPTVGVGDYFDSPKPGPTRDSRAGSPASNEWFEQLMPLPSGVH